jgi:hypothetical protein
LHPLDRFHSTRAIFFRGRALEDERLRVVDRYAVSVFLDDQLVAGLDAERFVGLPGQQDPALGSQPKRFLTALP